jgi:hypothetical protein
MEGRQYQVQIGEDVVKIWLKPLELFRESVESGVRPACRFPPQQRAVSLYYAATRAACGEGAVMLAAHALFFLAGATTINLLLASLRKLLWS